MNINQIIEIKKEYTIQLTNILAPLVYQGITHIYTELIGKCEDSQILKNFQILLKSIKNWSHDRITTELNRIYLNTTKYPWFPQLIQAVFKINQIILGVPVSQTLKNELTMGVYIHHVYIECGREFTCTPFLFYHKYSPIEVSRNNNKIIKRINICIENAMRRLLPMGIILDKFTEDKSIDSKNIDNINDIYNMPLLLELSYDININSSLLTNLEGIKILPEQMGTPLGTQLGTQLGTPLVKQEQFVATIAPEQSGTPLIVPLIPELPNTQVISHKDTALISNPGVVKKNMTGGDSKHNKILEIINNQGIKLSDSNEATMPFINKSYSNVTSSNSDKKNSKKNKEGRSTSTLKNIIDNASLQNMHNSSNKSSLLVDSKVKNLLLKELDSESITYHAEENTNNYQDIFSNSDIKKDTVNTLEKNDKKNRQIFFNNYLNI